VTSGNTDTSTFNLTFNATYDPKTRHVVKTEGLFLRGTSNGVTNVDRTTLMGSDQYKLTEHAFVFGQLQYLRDRFKDISYLIAPSAGLGYKVVDTPMTTLSAEAGMGGVWEKDTGLDVKASGAVIANQKLMHKISASATLNESVSGLWKTSDFADALYTFGGGLALGVTTRLQVKIELLDTYKNRPPSPTAKKNDVATILALVYKF
jgi:putative salt-induced outer membrane protein YdiY